MQKQGSKVKRTKVLFFYADNDDKIEPLKEKMYLVIGIVFAFVLLPFLLFLSGIFLIYNAIILEDQSRTTYENLLYSKEIGEKLVADPQFLFVTNDYHVFRTSTYARKLGMKGDGLGCRTAGYYIPSAFIREYVALCVKLK